MKASYGILQGLCEEGSVLSPPLHKDIKHLGFKASEDH